jgi:hypothetical protein
MPKKISPEVNARAVRMVQDHQQDYPSVTAAARAVAKQLGLGRGSLFSSRWTTHGTQRSTPAAPSSSWNAGPDRDGRGIPGRHPNKVRLGGLVPAALRPRRRRLTSSRSSTSSAVVDQVGSRAMWCCSASTSGWWSRGCAG